MYYPCSENKGANQLRGYRKADLRLCFCICRLLVFPCGGSYIKGRTVIKFLILGCVYFFSSNMYLQITGQNILSANMKTMAMTNQK